MKTKLSSTTKIIGITLLSLVVLAGCQNSSQTNPQPNPQSNPPTDSNNQTPTPSSSTAAETQGAVVAINTKKVDWNGEIYTFIQSCSGQQKTGKFLGDENKPIDYCLGKSELNLVDSKKVSTKIAADDTTDPTKTPLFIDAQWIPGSEGMVLLSYRPEACTTTFGTEKDACGAGMPSNYVNMVVNLADGTKRDLENYPMDGTAL